MYRRSRVRAPDSARFNILYVIKEVRKNKAEVHRFAVGIYAFFRT